MLLQQPRGRGIDNSCLRHLVSEERHFGHVGACDAHVEANLGGSGKRKEDGTVAGSLRRQVRHHHAHRPREAQVLNRDGHLGVGECGRARSGRTTAGESGHGSALALVGGGLNIGDGLQLRLQLALPAAVHVEAQRIRTYVIHTRREQLRGYRAHREAAQLEASRANADAFKGLDEGLLELILEAQRRQLVHQVLEAHQAGHAKRRRRQLQLGRERRHALGCSRAHASNALAQNEPRLAPAADILGLTALVRLDARCARHIPPEQRVARRAQHTDGDVPRSSHGHAEHCLGFGDVGRAEGVSQREGGDHRCHKEPARHKRKRQLPERGAVLRRRYGDCGRPNALQALLGLVHDRRRRRARRRRAHGCHGAP